MIGFARKYVTVVDAVNYRMGRIIMYGIFVMVGVLLWSSISKTFFLPSLWTLEIAQFAMVTYYILGGPYSIQLGSNVRMDLFYGEWTDRRKARFCRKLRLCMESLLSPDTVIQRAPKIAGKRIVRVFRIVSCGSCARLQCHPVLRRLRGRI